MISFSAHERYRKNKHDLGHKSKLVPAIGPRLEAIPLGLEAIASRLEAIAISRFLVARLEEKLQACPNSVKEKS